MESNGEHRPTSSSRQIEVSECELHDIGLARIMLEMSNEIRYLAAKVHTLESTMTDWICTQRDYIDTVNKRDIVTVKTRGTQSQSSPLKAMNPDLSYADALKSHLHKTKSHLHAKENKSNDDKSNATSSNSNQNLDQMKVDNTVTDTVLSSSEPADEKLTTHESKATEPTDSKTTSKVTSVVKVAGSRYDGCNVHSKKSGGSRSSPSSARPSSLHDVTNDRKVFTKHAQRSANEKIRDKKREEDSVPMLKRYPRVKSTIAGTDTVNEDEEADDSRYLPRVIIYHDSILKHLDAEKLGKAYGCKVEKEKCYLLNQVQERMKEKEPEEKPDAIVIHCGVNEFKTSHPKKAAENLVSIVRDYKRKTPHTPVVISGIAPTAVGDLNKKKNFFNSTVTSALFEEKDVFVIQHENLHFEHIVDRVHPNRGRGSSILATNIGRTLRNLFWVEGEKTRRQRQKKWWELNVLNY